jgi:hypothetical protein
MSAATYARRGGLMAMVGIAPVDDDGNAAVAPPTFAKVSTADVKREVEAEHNAGKPLASQYQVDKAKKAAAWVTASIALIETLKSESAISAWWSENSEALERLERNHQAEYDRLMVVIDKRRDQVPQIMQAG